MLAEVLHHILSLILWGLGIGLLVKLLKWRQRGGVVSIGSFLSFTVMVSLIWVNRDFLGSVFGSAWHSAAGDIYLAIAGIFFTLTIVEMETRHEQYLEWRRVTLVAELDTVHELAERIECKMRELKK